MRPASWSVCEERLDVRREAELPWLQVRVRTMAARAGLDELGRSAVALAATEAATNMLKYAGGGQLTVRTVDGPRAYLEIEALDHGPGIADTTSAAVDGVSGGTQRAAALWPLRSPGLGLGLGAIYRLMSDVTIRANPAGGTILTARRYV